MRVLLPGVDDVAFVLLSEADELDACMDEWCDDDGDLSPSRGEYLHTCQISCNDLPRYGTLEIVRVIIIIINNFF